MLEKIKREWLDRQLEYLLSVGHSKQDIAEKLFLRDIELDRLLDNPAALDELVKGFEDNFDLCTVHVVSETDTQCTDKRLKEKDQLIKLFESVVSPSVSASLHAANAVFMEEQDSQDSEEILNW